MPIDLSVDHTIKLQRHAKKSWSHGNNPPDVVEAAVLDYLLDYGVNGYFTGRGSYQGLLMTLAGWPGKILKRMPPAFCSPFYVYEQCLDGWLPGHTYTRAQVMAELEATSVEILTRKLQAICNGHSFLRGYYGPTHKQPEHIIEFLKAFGVDQIKKDVNEAFPIEVFQAKKFLFAFDSNLYSLHRRAAPFLDAEGVARNLKPVGIFNRAFHFGGGFDKHIDTTEEYANHLTDEDIRNEILYACAFARKCRERTVALYDTTVLDLHVWDEKGMAAVEVKAPGDRLRPAQKNTLALERAKGRRACVITVEEL